MYVHLQRNFIVGVAFGHILILLRKTPTYILAYSKLLQCNSVLREYAKVFVANS